ncbi:carbohydrate-binding module family 13 protein [Phycomyces blakesleeanus NRRL 1555(-)]|uniref:Carbohydrate-binding module family 13 protein n=1 Tax=Phycomyces blakesleeanus (strain ATCC 8743b / DSM 1359 / FGSC 10004 / NBRC 33097 / NRRL 1555) TaxID=763407 RepID=A0A162PT92_PHYB8|nr:carbohydrate-binding module family 13 protein [Phycomyces blakesleeanus NRRL 1555(-)]OAD73706.1 carbohydrate-binding module family 13 protein [Phycomyces blakesleeanus NRRL 1555(-)]|eukprot:XP_018291746.1 carbohydrate-binding module family 13 protein [Phycomyces blakesleeanus NRRL 1555(-)]
MSTSDNFPEGWFFIKNLSNGYVLMVENPTPDAGSPVVISSIRTKDADSQLWNYNEQGHLTNKKTGLVMDVAKGNAKAGSDIVQQTVSTTGKPENNYQTFGTTVDGHVYLKQKPTLVLGIKESFFSRREGLHVHLQLMDKRHLERKEQRWEFIVPIIKTASSATLTSVSTSTSLKRAPSVGPAETATKPLGRDLTNIKEDDARSIRSTSSSLDQEESQRIPIGTFPETAFFLKSQTNGYYIGTEAGSIAKSGTRLTIDSLRKSAYDSQLWTFDPTTHRIVNKHSGLVLSIEGNSLAEDAYACQSAPFENSGKTQAWTLSPEGEICLRNDNAWVLGYKDSWFSNREGAHLHLQRSSKNNQLQRFSVVLPVFKKHKAETITTVEHSGVFPEGWFFVKSQAQGLVLTVLESGTLAAQAVAVKLDTANYSRQLWKYNNGTLVNKASEMVLDVKGGSLVSGAEICQYKEKPESTNQQWGLTADGCIHIKSFGNLVLSVNANEKSKSNVFLATKSTDQKEQRWNFVLPVFKKKTTVREVASTPTVKKTITYRYAQYPTGWFFIRSFQTGSTKENPLVLTSDKSTQTIRLARLSRESWRYQLWSYSNGSLINYETDMAIDVSSIVAGAGLIQNKKQEIASQRWSLSIEGYLIQDSEPTMALIPQEEGSDKYKLSLGAHGSKQEYRWGLLIPQFGYKAGSQVLLEWTIHYLKEWRRSGSQTIQKTVHSVAAWPEDVFYIRAHDGLAVVPKTAEAYSEITLRKLEVSNASEFQWAFRNGRITHVSSGLILEAVDELAHGKLLQLSVEEANNARQQWVIKTDGSIVSQSQNELGFSLVQKSNVWLLQLSDSTKASSTHYAWSVLYGRYESSVLIGFRRIILTILTTRTTTNRQLVTHRYAIFPKGWFFVRSKADESLVLTIENTKQGTKIILAKLDFKIFRRQLWQYRDDGCLSNMDTDFVIDVAGGALLANSSVIQWQEKSLKKQRKNQLWGLSVEGHIHPQSRSGLVLGPKGDKISEGAEIQLRARGGLDLKYQQWNFATPQFGKRSPGSEISRTDSTLTIEGVSVPKEVATADAERYERITKRTIIRRWGRFPDGSFFVRAFNGKDHLALTVVESSKTQVAGGAEYTVSLQAINFKAYKWQFWTYQDGHLINVQTGLALDSRSVKDAMVESGLRSQLRVREVSSAETQFWGLSANGEIHQKSNERLVAGVSSAERTTVEGAQIGLRQLRTVKTNANNVEESKLQSEEWLRWMFSKPLFTTRTITRTVGNETTETTEEVLDKVEEIPVTVQEVNESEGEESDSEEENDEDSEDEVEEELSPESPAPNSAAVDTVTTTVNKDGEGKTTTTTTTTTTRGVVSEKAPEKEVITKPIPAVAEKQEASLKKSNSSKSLRLGRKDSFQLSEDYIPTGFEKVVRYKTHQGNFPTGYFLIKSHLHGYVLDIQGDAVDEAYVILTRIKVTDFSSQLWCYRDGLIYNLKNPSLVLDAAKQTIISGERAHLSIQHADDGRPEDRIWDHNSEEGLINLRAKRSLVLSVKELRRSENYTHIDVYVMEEKVHTHQKGKGAGARREQRWEILIPSLIPVAQADGGVKIVEAGKVSSVSSSASALLAFRGLKETFIHKITSTNQWPSTDKWFFIRYGAEDYFLAADEEKQVGVYKLQDNDDYKRFLWIYVDGYLVNYKYLLRLVLNENKRWILSNSYDQTFQISARGVITVRIQKIIYYLRIVRRSNRYELIASTEESGDGYVMQLHIPIFSDNEIEKDCHNASTTVVTSVRQPSRTTTVTTIIRRAFFPDSAWFFIKVDRKEQEDLVLAVEKESETADSKLVVKKLNLRSFQSQLWTYRDGLLINYGSKLVIDVKDVTEKLQTITDKTHEHINTHYETVKDTITDDHVKRVEIIESEKPTVTEVVTETVVIRDVKPTSEKPKIVEDIVKTIKETDTELIVIEGVKPTDDKPTDTESTAIVLEGLETIGDKPTFVVKETDKGKIIVVEGVKVIHEKPTVKDITTVVKQIEETFVIVEGIEVTEDQPTVTEEVTETIVVRGVKPTSDKPETVEDVVKTIEETTTSVTVIEGVKPVDDEKKPTVVVKETTEETVVVVEDVKPVSDKPTVKDIETVIEEVTKETIVVEGIKVVEELKPLSDKPTIVEEVVREVVIVKDVEVSEDKPKIVEDVVKTIKETDTELIVIEGVKPTEDKPSVTEVTEVTETTEKTTLIVEGVEKTEEVPTVKDITTVIEEVTEESIIVEGIEVVKGEKPTVTRETKEVIVVEGVKPTAEQPEVVDNVRETVTKTTTTTVIEGVEVTEEKPTVVVRESTEGTVVVVEGVKPTTEKPTVKDIKKVFETIEKTSVIVEGIKITGKKPKIVTQETEEGTIVVIEDVEFIDEQPTVVEDVTTVIEDTESTAIVLEGLETIGDKPTFVVKETDKGKIIVVEGVKVIHEKPTVKDITTVVKQIEETFVIVEGIEVTEDQPIVTEEVTETIIVRGVKPTSDKPETVEDVVKTIEETTTSVTVIEGVQPVDDEKKPTVVVKETTEETVVVIEGVKPVSDKPTVKDIETVIEEVTKETVVVEGVKVVEKKPETKTREVPTKEVVIPEGTEHGLSIVEETNKTVSGWLSGLVTRFTSPTDEDNKPTTTTERSIEHVTVTSEKELDRICDEAKEKVITQISKVTGQKPTKEEQDKLVRAIDSMKETAKVTLTEVKETTIAHKDKPEDVTEKLQTITDKTHEHITTHYETVKDTITDDHVKRVEIIESEKPTVTEVVTETVVIRDVKPTSEKPKNDEEDVLEKIVKTSLAIGGATAIATGTILHEEKKPVEKPEQRDISVVEDVIVEETIVISEQETKKQPKVKKPQDIELVKKENEVAVSIIEDTKQSTIGWFTIVTKKIADRVKQGGENVAKDVTYIVETAEKEIQSILEKKPVNLSETVDFKVNEGISTVKKSITEQITAVKKAIETIEVDASPEVAEKLLKVCEDSKKELDTVFVTVTETIVVDDVTLEEVDVVVDEEHIIVKDDINEVDTTKEIVRAITEEQVAVVQTAQDATESVRSWFTILTDKISSLLDLDDDCEQVNSKTKIAIAEAEEEIATKIAELKETAKSHTVDSDDQTTADLKLDEFFGNLQTSVNDQLKTVKSTVVTVTTEDNKQSVKDKLSAVNTKLNDQVTNYFDVVQKATVTVVESGNDVIERTVKDRVEDAKFQIETGTRTITRGVKKTKDEVNEAIVKVATGAATIAAISTAKSQRKPEDTVEVVEEKVTEQVIQVVEAPKVQQVQYAVYDWYTTLSKRITDRVSQGGENVTEDVEKITESAQKELEVTITKAKEENVEEVPVSQTESDKVEKNFYSTLEWIRSNANNQVNQIKTIVSEGANKVDVKSQIDNFTMVARQQVGNALTIHTPVKTIKNEEAPTTVTSTQTVTKVSQDGSIVNVVVIVDETKEEVEERTRTEMVHVVDETKTNLAGWLDGLLVSTREIIRRGGNNCREEVTLLVKNAEEEATQLVQDAKIKFITINKSAPSQSEEIRTLVSKTQKEALDCLDNIKDTIHSRVVVIEDVVSSSDDLSNFDVIDEKLTSTVTRTKNQIKTMLDRTTESSIGASFQGKTITWTKTLEVPRSFGEVRAFAFDVAGTAVDYLTTLLKVWRTVTLTKRTHLYGFDSQAFIIRWYKLYLIERTIYGRSTSDYEVFRIVLIRLLKERSIEHLFTDYDVKTLCSAWSRLDLFSDTVTSVRSIKKQSKMDAVAISPTFSTRTMVDLARHGCLCWHAQFTSEMFAATSDGSTAEVVVSGTTEFLALEHPGQLAVVSSNPLVLEAARKQGSRTVLLNRYDETYNTTYDLKVERLDVLAESFHSFLNEEATL